MSPLLNPNMLPLVLLTCTYGAELQKSLGQNQRVVRYITGQAVGELQNDVNVILDFSGRPTATASTLLSDRYGRVALYVDEHGFFISTDTNTQRGETTVLNVNDFIAAGIEHVAFSNVELLLGPIQAIGAQTRIAISECKTADGCAFRTESLNFTLSMTDTVHRLPNSMQNVITTVNAHGTSFKIDATEYNSYVPENKGESVSVSFAASPDIVIGLNGSHVSLYVMTSDIADVAFAFAALLSVSGIVMFVGVSVHINDGIDSTGEVPPGAVLSIGGKGTIMHIVLVDMATTAMTVVLYQSVDPPPEGTYPIAMNNPLAAIATAVAAVISVLLCSIVIAVVASCTESTGKQMRFGDTIRQTAAKAVGPPTGMLVVACRCAYEVLVLTAFLSSLPMRCGKNFALAVSFGCSSAMLYIIGRDAYTINTLGAGAVAGYTAWALAASGCVVYGILFYQPMIHSSRSFSYNIFDSNLVGTLLAFCTSLGGAMHSKQLHNRHRKPEK